MLVLRFEPAQPDDSGDYRISTGGVRRKDLTGKPAIVKYRTGRRMIANFLGNLQKA